MSLNVWTFTGNLGRDASQKYLPNGRRGGIAQAKRQSLKAKRRKAHRERCR